VPREHNQRDYYDLVDYEEEENPLKGNLITADSCWMFSIL